MTKQSTKDFFKEYSKLCKRQELISNHIMEIIEYPDQIKSIIDVLVSQLHHRQLDKIENLIDNQLEQIEDFIVNNYSVE